MKLVKKWLSFGILVFTFLVVGATISPSVSSAEDVWFYSDGSWSFYLCSETINDRGNEQPKYTVQVKKVFNGTYQGDFEFLGFTSDGSYCYWYNRMNGRWEGSQRVSASPYTSAAWRAMQPYL